MVLTRGELVAVARIGMWREDLGGAVRPIAARCGRPHERDRAGRYRLSVSMSCQPPAGERKVSRSD